MVTGPTSAAEAQRPEIGVRPPSVSFSSSSSANRAETTKEAVVRGTNLSSTGQYDEAARLFKLAANQGDASAQFNLGWLYKNGRGVQKSDAEPKGRRGLLGRFWIERREHETTARMQRAMHFPQNPLLIIEIHPIDAGGLVRHYEATRQFCRPKVSRCNGHAHADGRLLQDGAPQNHC